MAEGDEVADDQHVVRYCKPSQVADGEVMGAAFQLDAGHDYHSVTWLERVSDAAERLGQLRAAVGAMRGSNLSVKPNGWLAVHRVSQITRVTEVAGTLLELVVRHHPDDANEGHSGIHGLPAGQSAAGTAVGLELARQTTEQPVQVRTLIG
jgi:hypothetical protein